MVSGGNYVYVMAPYRLFTQQFMQELKGVKNRYGQSIIPIAYTVKLGIEYMMTDTFKTLAEESKK